MSSLAELPEVIGFFSYSRDDDEDFGGTLSALRDAIQRELRAQLGRSRTTFRLWQDKEAIAPGTLWESEIKNAVAQSVFFIPIVTPRMVNSRFCQFEFDAFLARERALGRTDLVFPILYVPVQALQNEEQWRNHPVLSFVAERQYVDWQTFRYAEVQSSAMREAIGGFARKIVEALYRSWVSPEERARQDEESQRQDEESQRQDEERRRQDAEAKARAEDDARRKKDEADARRLAQEEAKRHTSEAQRKPVAEVPGLAEKPIVRPEHQQSTEMRSKTQQPAQHEESGRRPVPPYALPTSVRAVSVLLIALSLARFGANVLVLSNITSPAFGTVIPFIFIFGGIAAGILALQRFAFARVFGLVFSALAVAYVAYSLWGIISALSRYSWIVIPTWLKIAWVLQPAYFCIYVAVLIVFLRWQPQKAALTNLATAGSAPPAEQA